MMLKRILPSPAMAVALVALFVALGSGAYAQVTANSVGTPQLRNGAVTNPKLARNSVWNAQLGVGSVRIGNMAANSVWHAQLGTGSVRLVNIQPATVDQLRSKSADFANPGPTHLTAAVEGVRVASDMISTTAGENFLVLNGFVIVDSVGDTDDAAVCFYDIDGSIVSSTQRVVPAKSEVQIGMVARHPVKAGTHTVDVFCRSTRTIDLIASDAQFTAIATG
jgi:hypothetical protein